MCVWAWFPLISLVTISMPACYNVPSCFHVVTFHFLHLALVFPLLLPPEKYRKTARLSPFGSNAQTLLSLSNLSLLLLTRILSAAFYLCNFSVLCKLLFNNLLLDVASHFCFYFVQTDLVQTVCLKRISSHLLN